MKPEKILIVDDSTFMRTVIRTRLEKVGYKIVEAADGLKALEMARQEPDIALITMDVEMPNLDGFATSKQLRSDSSLPEYLKTVPIVFITSYDSVEDRRRGFDLGATDFVGKENIETDLVSTVDRILRPGTDMTGLEALVVDDSFFSRKIISRILSSRGIVVTEADNGKSALDIISHAPGRFDILITDLNMPVMDGMELTRKVRLELGMHQIPIIMLSVSDDKVTQIELFKAGITDYLTKPFLKEELLGRLHSHVEVALFNKKLKEYLLELKRSKETIERINSERGELLHVLCHDLANPIGAVISVLDLVGDDTALFGRFRDELHKSAEHGLAVINMVREIRALEENKRAISPGEIDLRFALQESIQILHRRLEEKNIHLNIDITGDPVIFAEEVSLVNCVFSNILTNAIKFSFRGGNIDIVSERTGDQLKLCVRDYGIGIPATILPHLFTSEKTTSRPGTGGETGTGFGMTLVRKFMEKYDGRIEIESKDETVSSDDHGTTVSLFFHAV